MPLGRPTGSGTPFFCKTCRITTLLKKSHLKGVAHRQNGRIRALLNKPCISFSEIGRRLGLTRERVRQIAEQFYQETGRQRQRACAINNPQYKLPSDSLASQAEKVCREKGFSFQFVSRQFGRRFSPNAAIIANEKCALRHCSERKNGNIVIRKPLLNAEDSKFMLTPMPDGRWLIVPRSKWPDKSTEFQPAALLRPGGKSKRHDWRAYIDAWHLLGVLSKHKDVLPSV